MAIGKCTKTGCPVAETGKCLDAHSDPEECPNFVDVENDVNDAITAEVETDTAKSVVQMKMHTLYSGFELGLNEAADLMRRRYTNIIGVLGESDAGKTCLLLSTYLLLSAGQLSPRFQFAGSRSLQGFEDRARRLREWPPTGLPEKFSEHTILEDQRKPAFLHLAIRDNALETTRDWLFSDLPGEWTTEAIKRRDVARRLGFVRFVDAILYVIDGKKLENRATRHLVSNNTRIAFQRLVELVDSEPHPPFAIVVSKGDEIQMQPPAAVAELTEFLRDHGVISELFVTAAVSRDANVAKSGGGIEALIRFIADADVKTPDSDSLASEPALERNYWRGIS